MQIDKCNVTFEIVHFDSKFLLLSRLDYEASNWQINLYKSIHKHLFLPILQYWPAHLTRARLERQSAAPRRMADSGMASRALTSAAAVRGWGQVQSPRPATSDAGKSEGEQESSRVCSQMTSWSALPVGSSGRGWRPEGLAWTTFGTSLKRVFHQILKSSKKLLGQQVGSAIWLDPNTCKRWLPLFSLFIQLRKCYRSDLLLHVLVCARFQLSGI